MNPSSRLELNNGKYIDDQMGNGIPDGGTTGQVLAKASNDDYDVEWVTGGGGGGTVTSVLPGQIQLHHLVALPYQIH
jgi:hypothetical protein